MNSFVVIQLVSRVQLFLTPCTAVHQVSLSFTISRSLLKLMPIKSVMPSNHLIFCCALLLPSVFPSIRVFSNKLALCIRWPKWSTGVSTSASVLPMNIQDWFPLGLTGLISLLSKGLKSLLQPHSLKASVIQCSVFFMVQFSHPYMTTEKNIALTIWTFVSKVMSGFSYTI